MILPPEILIIIFTFLKDRPGLLRQVCKEWKAIVDGSFKKPTLILKRVSVETVNLIKWSMLDLPLDRFTCSSAAEGGHLEVLQWARANDCPWDGWTCAYAASGGHLEVLQWARENGCPWNRWTCAYAAFGGHLEVLQWARANDCPWDEWTCYDAAEGGHLEVLQWARENGCPE